MQFLYQPLTWGFLLAGVPILIHLINMLRHRRQQWAAMDFLLESYRKNRRWVALKQWLLLAARILAMVLMVAMLAKWISNAQWLSWFGGKTTHHYVLLDDSYSMSDVGTNGSSYDRALGALRGLVQSIAGRSGQHQLTLVRWSRAALASRNDQEARVDSAADLIAQTVPRDPGTLIERILATSPTALQLDPADALSLVSSSITESAGEKSVIYVLSDMRTGEFGEPKELRNRIETLVQSEAEVNLVDCGVDVGTNITVANIEPEQGVWAAGVPLMVRFQIRNQSQQNVKNLVVRIRTITYANGAVTPQVELPYSGQISDLPPTVIEEIGAGESVTRQVQVIFGMPGEHVVEVSIPDDALQVDNRRWCVVGISQSQRVLLVDGSVDQSNAFFFETLMRPDARLQTGMSFERVDASYLRDASPSELSAFDVVALLDVPRLDAQAIEKLEKFCRDGGGVFFLAGENTNVRFSNENLFRAGEGLYPVELTSIEEIADPKEAGELQVFAESHPILGPLQQLSSSPFMMLRIRKLLSAKAADALPKSDTAGASNVADLQLVAVGPGQRPLIVDRAYGDGHVVAMLTGLSNDWSTWAQDPTFVVLGLRSLGYLASFRREAASRPVGESIDMVASGASVLPEGEVLVPPLNSGLRFRIQREVQTASDSGIASLTLGVDLEAMDRDVVAGLLRPGIFESWMTSVDGSRLVHNLAHNVAAAEGDLTRITGAELQQKLQGVEFNFTTADSLSGLASAAQETASSTFLMAALALLLLGEQALAYSASYHAPFSGGSRR